MLIQKSKINQSLPEPFNLYNTAFLDIETNGLSHKHKLVIIGLIVYPKASQSGDVIQLFNDDFSSERDMLLTLIEILSKLDLDYLISFNGNAFDIPFLNARYAHYKIDYHISKACNIDLLRIARSNQALLKLSDLKLKTIETALGIHRDDTISGKDSIILFDAYIETRSEKLKETILLHNYDDLINMIPLIQITQSATDYLPHFYYIENRKWFINYIKFNKEVLEISLSLNQRLSIQALYYDKMDLFFNCENTDALLKIDTLRFKDPHENVLSFVDSHFLDNVSLDQIGDAQRKQYFIALNNQVLNDHVLIIVERYLRQLVSLLYQK